MAALEALRGLFVRPDITKGLPTDAFLAIDREAASRKLRIKERGEQNGRRNHPPADSADLDEVEREIIAEIGEIVNRTQIEASNNHRVYGERLAELALLRELSTITGASDQALGDYKTTVINREGRLSLAKSEIRESFKDLANFKQEHGLHRPAHEGINPVYAWSTFGIAWIVESACNTIFLATHDDRGFVGASLAAAVVAGVNLAFSGVYGRAVLPFLFHRKLPWKLTAGVLTVAWLTLSLGWNLLAGHYRDAKFADALKPEVASLSFLLDAPFSFDGLYSYGLLFVGLISSMVAVVAAFKMKDPYPGYGDVYARHKKRCEAYADEIELTLEELRDTREEAIQHAKDTREELQRQFRERGRIIESRNAHRARYREHQDYLQSIADSLIGEYRAANTASRPDGLRPASFNSPWRMIRTELPSSPDEPSIEQEVLRAQEALEASIQMVAREYEGAITRFEHLDKIKESLGDV